MECGSQEFFCQVAGWLSEKAGGRAEQYLHVASYIRDLGDWAAAKVPVIFGFFGFVFGVWKWWHYRDKILHQRFESYLRASERHLQHTRSDIIERIQRPGPGHAKSEPLFVDDDLCAVLREHNWIWALTS